ncbi:MAG: flagellar hook-associated protein FlgL [Planctomycetaceae bacterium]|nr:flagellar hook-associated protein FlgL [Planctomycetaceae bacterium]
MSGTNQIFNSVLSSLRAGSNHLARLQEQMATGQRINRASDSPTDAAVILNLRQRVSSIETFSRNLDMVNLNLNEVATAITSVSDALTQATQLLSQAASETFVEKDRLPAAEAIDVLLEQMVSLANTQSAQGYVFGGSNMSQAPYAVTRSDGKIVSVSYCGSTTTPMVAVATGVQQSHVLVGENVFQTQHRQPPVFTGATGAAVGSATSSVTGSGWLTIAHAATTYLGATGLAAGTSSPAGDTILGDAHAITVDADAHTLSLDGGDAVAFDRTTDDNVRLVNARGDVVYVDTTGFDAGLAGTISVSLKATGTMSLDGGATTSPLTSFADNQIVIDARTGRSLFVDTTAIARTGSESVNVAGTHDLFETLIAARDALGNTRSLTRNEQTTMIAQALDSLKEVHETILSSLTSVGARQQALDGLSSSLATMKEGAEGQASSLQSADVAEVATELARYQTFYEMTLSAAAKIMNVSLLDYI